MNLKLGIYKHINCRNAIYLHTDLKRFNVSNEQIDWNISYPEYRPPFYESNTIKGKPWADPDINDPEFKPKWNEIDGNVNRSSHIPTKYKLIDKYPINPYGRTGLIGRGLLGRWGPNHACDPIVTRWKCDPITMEKIIDNQSKKKILQMIAIQRKDTKEWAIPGGMVDPGEQISATLKREFMEETLNDVQANKNIDEFFTQYGTEIYSGYVDDQRNTDNAWMETTAYNYHDENMEYVGKLNLNAGDDAVAVKWLDLNENIQLYASHKLIIENVIKKLSAHW